MENELGRVVDTLPGLIWTALPDGRADFLNQHWRDYTGLDVGDAHGRAWQEAVHPDDLAGLLERWRPILDSGAPGEAEARLRRADGEYRWFLFRTQPLRDASGRVVKWCGMNTDIEDRKRAEEALRESERRFGLIVDGLPAVVTLMSADGTLAHANRHMLDYFGKTLDELKAKPLGHTFHPDDRDGVLARWRRSVETGDPFDDEVRFRRADGVYRWFHTQGFPLRDAAGNIVLWYLLQVDIDDRKRAEALLAGEKRLLEMVARGQAMPDVLEALCRFVESIVDGCRCSVVLVDPTGSHLEHGVAPSLPASFIEAIVGRPVDAASGPCTMAAHLNEQVTSADLRSETRWADGAWCPMALAHGLHACISTPIPSTAGKVLGALAVYFDEPGAHGSLHRGIIEQFTHLASIAIERARNDEALRQGEALLAGEKQLLEMVATGCPLPAVLERLCLIFEGLADDCTCSVVLVDATGTELRQGASPSVPAGFMDSVDGRPVGVEYGPCATAIYLNAPVISPDVELETRWRTYGWPQLALSHGLRAVWSTPIGSRSGKVIGSFALHYHAPATPTPHHQNLIDRFTHLASIVIERAQDDAALKRSEAYLTEAQKLSLTGSFGWSVAEDEHFWSEETFRIFGYAVGTRVTLPLILDRVHPEDGPELRRAIELAAEGADLDYECRLLMPGGAVKHVHIVGHGLRDADGRLEYIGAVQDVTERRLSEEALAKVRSELARVARITSLGALTASIAHEVNQPLSGIITNASTCLRMLAADPPNVDGARETARRTIRDGNRASDVITRLRALFGKKSVPAESVDLNEAAREVIALASCDLQRSRVLLRAELAENLPPVTGDRIQLQQVVLNLLLNGSEAMRETDDRPRQLTLRTERDGADQVRVSVRDAGTGFEPHGAGRLFDAFYTTKSDGMGMGLSISRSIVESHCGRLWATPNDGPGATFAFSIPHGPERAADAPGAAVTIAESV